MSNIIVMIAATAAAALVVLGLVRGKEYAPYVAGLSSDEHPLKDCYVIGFFLSTLGPFKLRGNLERELKQQSKLYWDSVYAEYYAVTTWAQFLTYALLIIAFGLAVSGVFPSDMLPFVLCITVLAMMAAWNLTISKMKEAVQTRREECEYEFPTMVSKLALLLGSGMVLRQAWYTVARGKEGPLYDLMKRSCDEMDNGMPEVEAIHKFGVLSDSNEIKKFTSAMIQGMEKGSGELAGFFLGQTSELWAHKRQLALQKGEVAAGKLIIPLGIMFGGIILIIISAAMQSMSF